VELDAVRSLKEDVLVSQPEIRRGADEIRVREKDDALFGIFQDHGGLVGGTIRFRQARNLITTVHDHTARPRDAKTLTRYYRRSGRVRFTPREVARETRPTLLS